MNRRILALAVPNIISNITIPLLGLVDLAIVGHLGSTVYIGAIAVGTTIFNFLYWNLAFLRMGTSGLTAQAYGKRDFTEAAQILVRALIISLVLAIFILLLHVSIGRMALSLISSSGEVEYWAYQYFSILVWGVPAVLAQYAIKGWFIGMQNAKTPMWISITVNILNILFSIILVYVLDLGVRGLAFGTLMAQYCDIGLAFIALRYSGYRKLWNRVVLRKLFQWNKMNEFFSLNSAIFLRTACLVTVFTFFTSQSATMGDTVLAVNALLMQFFTLFSYFMDGFGYAGEALAGRYIGARNRRLLKESVFGLMRWGLALSLVVSAVYFVFGKNLLYLLTNMEDVIEVASGFLPWILAVPITSFMAFLWDGIYIGAAASSAMRNCMFVAMILFFTVYYLCKPVLGHEALWLAFLSFLTLRSMLQTVFAKRVLTQKIDVTN